MFSLMEKLMLSLMEKVMRMEEEVEMIAKYVIGHKECGVGYLKPFLAHKISSNAIGTHSDG